MKMNSDDPACDGDRSWLSLRKERSTHSVDVEGFRPSSRQRWMPGALDVEGSRSSTGWVQPEVRLLRNGIVPLPATTPVDLIATSENQDYAAVILNRRSSCRSSQPARAELPRSVGELHPRRRSAHFYPPTANHSRVQGELRIKFVIPYFDGNLFDEDYLEWEQEVENLLHCTDMSQEKLVRNVIRKLEGRAAAWWYHLTQARHHEGRSNVKTWLKMKRLLRAQFLTPRFDKVKPVRDSMMEALQLWKNFSEKGENNAQEDSTDRRVTKSGNGEGLDDKQTKLNSNRSESVKDSSLDSSPTGGKSLSKGMDSNTPGNAAVILKKKVPSLKDKELNPEFFQKLETRSSNDVPVEVVLPSRCIEPSHGLGEEEQGLSDGDSRISSNLDRVPGCVITQTAMREKNTSLEPQEQTLPLEDNNSVENQNIYYCLEQQGLLMATKLVSHFSAETPWRNCQELNEHDNKCEDILVEEKIDMKSELLYDEAKNEEMEPAHSKVKTTSDMSQLSGNIDRFSHAILPGNEINKNENSRNSSVAENKEDQIYQQQFEPSTGQSTGIEDANPFNKNLPYHGCQLFQSSDNEELMLQHSLYQSFAPNILLNSNRPDHLFVSAVENAEDKGVLESSASKSDLGVITILKEFTRNLLKNMNPNDSHTQRQYVGKSDLMKEYKVLQELVITLVRRQLIHHGFNTYVVPLLIPQAGSNFRTRVEFF